MILVDIIIVIVLIAIVVHLVVERLIVINHDIDLLHPVLLDAVIVLHPNNEGSIIVDMNLLTYSFSLAEFLLKLVDQHEIENDVVHHVHHQQFNNLHNVRSFIRMNLR